MHLFFSSARSTRSFREWVLVILFQRHWNVSSFPSVFFLLSLLCDFFTPRSFYKAILSFLFSILIFIFFFLIFIIWYLLNLIVKIYWVGLAWPGLAYRLFSTFLFFILISHRTNILLFNSNVSINNRLMVFSKFPVPILKWHFVFLAWIKNIK